VDKLGYVSSVINGQQGFFSLAARDADLFQMEKYVPLQDGSQDTNTRLVKQRSPEWFAIRKWGLATGSTLANAVGVNDLKRQQQHFDQVFLDVSPPEPPAAQK
jgi:hypothetical protein